MTVQEWLDKLSSMSDEELMEYADNDNLLSLNDYACFAEAVVKVFINRLKLSKAKEKQRTENF